MMMEEELLHRLHAMGLKEATTENNHSEGIHTSTVTTTNSPASSKPQARRDEEDDPSSCPTTTSMTVVLVPADVNQSILTLQWDNKSNNNTNPDESLLLPSSSLSTSFWEPYFALTRTESVDMEAIRAQVLPAYEKGCHAAGGMCPHVSWDTLQQHAAVGNVQYVDVRIPSSSSSLSKRIGIATKNNNINDDENETTIWRCFYDESARLKTGRIRNQRIHQLLSYAQDNNKQQQEGEGEDEIIVGDVFIVPRPQQDGVSKSLWQAQDVWEILMPSSSPSSLSK